MTTSLYRVNKFCFQVAMVVFNQDLHKSQMKEVQSEILESKKGVVLDMEEGQDKFDPEFYLAQYQLKNIKERSMKTLCGRYRDVVSCGPGDEFVTDRPECETSDSTPTKPV